jgi:hypothetical protein
MRDWIDVPLDTQMFQNLDESVLRRSPRTLENGFINEAKGHSRFPGLTLWKTLDGGGNVYLHDWQGDLVAVTDHGRIFRIDMLGNVTDVTGVVPAGNGRVVFAKTDDQLVMAAGGPIVQLNEPKTTLLSVNAPLASHVGYLSGFLLANEIGSQRFWRSEAGQFTTWDPLAFVSVESNPDDVTALVVTEFGEALLAGPHSVEQFEPYPGGDTPFFRRWSVGEGLVDGGQYTLIAADNGIWAVNRLQEFVRYQGQNAKAESLAISRLLESIENWQGSWSALMHLFGQKFIIIKIPNAVSEEYGTPALTLLFDYKERRMSFLHGWDENLNLPTEWPGHSYHNLGGQHFVGGTAGQIFKLDANSFLNNGVRQQMFWRSAHMDDVGKCNINGVRFRLRRGAPSSGYGSHPEFQIRVQRDNRHWGRWQTRSLGASGDREMYVNFGPQGNATTWQWEYRCGANVPVEVVRMQVEVVRRS